MSTSPEREADDDLIAVGARRRARERALELLYEAEAKDETSTEVLASLPAPPEPYALELFSGVGEHLVAIDEEIESNANLWALERLSVVDRQLLRIGAFELMFCLEVPVAVVIDEAVELAKQYSTEESGRFVNGVLSTIASLHRVTGQSKESSQPKESS